METSNNDGLETTTPLLKGKALLSINMRMTRTSYLFIYFDNDNGQNQQFDEISSGKI